VAAQAIEPLWGLSLDNLALLIFFGFALFSLLPVDWRDETTARRQVGCMMLSVMTIWLYAMMR
jgi:hypothetical protein